MHIHYISPSTLPSRSANSIHVIRMCQALTQLGHNLTLSFKRTQVSRRKSKSSISSFYGIDLSGIKVWSSYIVIPRGSVFLLGLLATARHFLNKKPDVVFSRNFYASYFISKLSKQPLIYETHTPKYGFKKALQKKLLLNKNTHTIVITKALKDILIDHHGLTENDAIDSIHVFPDAAPHGILKLDDSTKKQLRNQFANNLNTKLDANKNWLGYLGHLYPGRGIEIILQLAKMPQHQNDQFLIFGGNETDIQLLKQTAKDTPNLHILGHLEPSKAISIMKLMDVLLMPYQNKVSIDHSHSNTAEWMSPMKMFEYMAAHVPIVSSDLPVLREVLSHKENALLATCDDAQSWSSCLQQLITEPQLAQKIADKAYGEYSETYNWLARSQNIIKLIKK